MRSTQDTNIPLNTTQVSNSALNTQAPLRTLFRQRSVCFDVPKVMGILNVTPDSFSDGGRFDNVDTAFMQAKQMLEEGATFIDVGGESTRPNAAEVSLQEELDRVIPVIEKITANLDVLVSIDTSKAQVMTAAVSAGASLINDVRALSLDGAMQAAANAAREHNVPACMMHMQGTPTTMQQAPEYDNIVLELMGFFSAKIAEAIKAGFSPEQLLIDPGFGFGKTLDHNYALLKHLQAFSQFKVPILVGTSRKSMIGNLLNRELDERLAGSIATATIAAMSGAHILRVHDVAQTVDAVKIAHKVRSTL